MKLLAKALIVVPILLVMGRCTFEYFVVDHCFDAGGAYDYVQGVCTSDTSGPLSVSPAPYYERFSFWLIVGMASVLAGIALLNVSDRKVP